MKIPMGTDCVTLSAEGTHLFPVNYWLLLSVQQS